MPNHRSRPPDHVFRFLVDLESDVIVAVFDKQYLVYILQLDKYHLPLQNFDRTQSLKEVDHELVETAVAPRVITMFVNGFLIFVGEEFFEAEVEVIE